jgi:hypothetical protein
MRNLSIASRWHSTPWLIISVRDIPDYKLPEFIATLSSRRPSDEALLQCFCITAHISFGSTEHSDQEIREEIAT